MVSFGRLRFGLRGWGRWGRLGGGIMETRVVGGGGR